MNQPPNQPPWGPPGPAWAPPGYWPPGGGYGHPGYPQPPRKSVAGLIIALVIGAVVLFGALVGVGVYAAKRDSDPTRRVLLASDDGKSEIAIPPSWSRQTGLNDEADLQAGNPAQEEYLIILTESKEDLTSAVSLSKYADVCLDGLKTKVEGATVTGPREVRLGDKNAIEYDVEGSVGIVKVHYLVTYVDGKTSFHQIMAWTLKSKFAGKRQKLVEVMATFRERDGG